MNFPFGRLTSSTIPEAVNLVGTNCPTTYSYDANGNLTSKTAPLENQFLTCTSTATTTYGYDALNRLTSKTYSDKTPPANYYYDQSTVTIGSWTSTTLTNPKGRMTEATITASGSINTALVYSYDAMGRPVNFWQCDPSNCGSASIWKIPYTYDLAGDVTSYTHMDGYTISTPVNAAQQVTSVQSTSNP